eukprot:symbB.v1.2.036650.t3/scaffold5221.1/size29670/3
MSSRKDDTTDTMLPFRRVVCQESATSPGCRFTQLGPGLYVELDLLQICQRNGLYSCNRSVTPLGAGLPQFVKGTSRKYDLCRRLPLGQFQDYVDEVLSINPFEGKEPWDVPQVDLSVSRAFIFLSQRQALYLALRTLALKMAKGRSSNAIAWIEEHPVFETFVPNAKLKRSACPVVPHAFQSALTDDSFGISFKHSIAAAHSVDELQAALDYMWLQHLELPILECCGPWWHVLAVLPSITFAQDENGQHIRLAFFDGQRRPLDILF